MRCSHIWPTLLFCFYSRIFHNQGRNESKDGSIRAQGINAAEFGEIIDQGQAKISKQPSKTGVRGMKNLGPVLTNGSMISAVKLKR